MEREYYAYIMSNQNNTVLYTGVTNNLWARAEAHSSGEGGQFTSRYRVNKLVYAESFSDVHEAIAREKQIKGGSRWKKIELIERANPEWKDLREMTLKDAEVASSRAAAQWRRR